MRHRVRDILMISSLYDSFILGEESGLYEMLINDYMELNLSHPPEITRVSSGREALELVADKKFDLIISTLHLEDMSAPDCAGKLRSAGVHIPLVLLTYDARELNLLMKNDALVNFNRVFMWMGNSRILLAIIKNIEDSLNLEEDTGLVGVQNIILIEDNVKFYSSYLPLIYTQLMLQSQNVIAEGVNLSHKILRMRARPKILLCETYEQAWQLFQTYHETVLGVISDVSFPHHGKIDPQAGIEFARNVKKSHRDIPILLQSNDRSVEAMAHEAGASFLLKNSPRLLHELKKYIRQYFSFGDFIFCLPDGTRIDRAHDLRELEMKLSTIPDESLLYHAERNHFSNWLKARTEFYLAYKLRPQKVSDYNSVADLRQSLIDSLREYHLAQHRGIVADFDPKTFNPESGFTRLGGGSLGGKGRGLAFIEALINMSGLRKEFPDINISIPPTIILETDVFDMFLEENDLGEFALAASDDVKIAGKFLKADLPRHVESWLRDILKVIKYPLAVRSSSLLEDSQYQPFAGVYETCMVPNNSDSLEKRLDELMSAIKRVFASTFFRRAKRYIKATPYRLEEEKMAVIIQKLVGRKHGQRFYPDASGVARSYNFYPAKPMKSEDGIVSAALGLGAIVVEGGLTTKFCPKYPRHQVQFSNAEDMIKYSQREFFALEIPSRDVDIDYTRPTRLLKLGLEQAEKDGTLTAVGSTYSRENDAVYDGLSRKGLRLITFAPILKHDFFPLATLIDRVLQIGREGMSTPVEIEFSVKLPSSSEEIPQFHLLQLRPMVVNFEHEQIDLNGIPDDKLICRSSRVLGNGVIDDIHDIVLVDINKFKRSKMVEIAREVALFNIELTQQNRPYILLGIGRWGSADPWLGIPVTWDEIFGARAIIETDFEDIKVAPSQGTHFFQNINAFHVGYFTIGRDTDSEFVDWTWLISQTPLKKRLYTRLLRFDRPLGIKMKGHSGEGIILKPTGL
ncbi:MAG: histidine kinase [candidate division Zixibacteria bacterium]|nr:histidine kinase [candidate division Zixibacteria bacterium]